MIKVIKNIGRSLAVDLAYIGPENRIIFFDIETTGLGNGKVELYLIGAVYKEDGVWRMVQWFSEMMWDEEPLLVSLTELIEKKQKEADGKPPILVTYNGDGFDIPFVSKLYDAYHLPDMTKRAHSFDFYRTLRRFKDLFGLPNMKLKTLERYIGIERKDEYSGGELIPVYNEYRRLMPYEEEKKNRLRDFLLLHNEEDIIDLPKLCTLLSYELLFKGGYSFASAKILELAGESYLDLSYILKMALPKELVYEDEIFAVSASGKEKKLLNIAVKLYKGELRYFYADYKNYYYLPMEDYAVHRSVGKFMDKSARQPAARANCYQRVKGVFLPEEGPIFTPIYRKAYADKQRYAKVDPAMLGEAELFMRYASELLGVIFKKIAAQNRGK